MNAAVFHRARKLLRSRSFVSIAGLVVVIAASALIALLVLQKALPGIDAYVQDWEVAYLLPGEPQDSAVVIVAITEDTLQRFHYRSPIDRQFLSDLLNDVASFHPRAIGLDVLLDQPTEDTKDGRLFYTVRHLPVPLVISYSNEPDVVTPAQLEYLDKHVPASERALPDLGDQVGTVREIFPGKRQKDRRYLSGFARAIAQAAGVETPQQSVAIAWRGQEARNEQPFPEFSADFVEPPPPAPSATPPSPALLKVLRLAKSRQFRDKVVLIGFCLSLDDLHRTPFSVHLDSGDADPAPCSAAAHGGKLPGIVILAHSVSQLLHHRAPPMVRLRVNLAIALLMSAIGGLLGMLNFHLLPRIFAALAAAAILCAAGGALYHYHQEMIGLVAPNLALLMSFSAADSLSGRDARKQRQFIQGAFARYVSPKVVEQLISEPDRMSLEGERREMTYLFTDIANFTTMSEGMDSKDLARVLNAYLDATTEVVLRHEGMVDKFIGDAIFAIFNAPVDLPDHPERAVRCALELDSVAEAFRARQNAENVPLGITRIGIHTGPAVIGNFGSSTRFNYTAQGDAVNIASRLEALNKHFGTHICVSGATRELCKTVRFRPIASVVLKGKTTPVEVWEPLRDGEKSDEFLQRYGEAFDALVQGPAEALPLFEALAKQAPGDPCVKLHVERLRGGLRGAAVVMEEK